MPQILRRAILSLGICLSVAGLVGCTALQGPAYVDREALASKEVQFPGLLGTAEPSNSTPMRRYIFQIHGINAVDDKWADQLFAGIEAKGYVRTRGERKPAKLKAPVIVKGRGLDCRSAKSGPFAPCRFDQFGVYWKDTFVNPNTHDEVTVFSYRWRDDMWRITGQYLQPDIDANKIPWWGLNTRKSLINSGLKADLLDNGISDAAGYISPLRDLAREGVESALCAMYADALESPEKATSPAFGAGCLSAMNGAESFRAPGAVEFNFLSHSLGSRMLYDVLTREQGSTPKLTARSLLVQRTRTFFMAANQMPLLAPVGVTVVPADEPALSTNDVREIDPFARRSYPETDTKSAPVLNEILPLTIVAFQDPDDLLGYKARDAVIAEPQDNVTIIDVVHRNTPQILFLLAWPASAHDHELKEPHSLELILCGGFSGPSGKLKAYRCKTGKP